jgi:hypothetical protein
VNEGFRTLCAFLQASRGVWSLGIFTASHWTELSLYFYPNTADSTATNQPNSLSDVDELGLVQLNVALQKEIVQCTAAGIRQSLRALEISKANNHASTSTSSTTSRNSTQQRSSSRTISGTFGLFVRGYCLAMFAIFFVGITCTMMFHRVKSFQGTRTPSSWTMLMSQP